MNRVLSEIIEGMLIAAASAICVAAAVSFVAGILLMTVGAWALGISQIIGWLAP